MNPLWRLHELIIALALCDVWSNSGAVLSVFDDEPVEADVSLVVIDLLPAAVATGEASSTEENSIFDANSPALLLLYVLYPLRKANIRLHNLHFHAALSRPRKREAAPRLSALPGRQLLNEIFIE